MARLSLSLWCMTSIVFGWVSLSTYSAAQAGGAHTRSAQSSACSSKSESHSLKMSEPLHVSVPITDRALERIKDGLDEQVTSLVLFVGMQPLSHGYENAYGVHIDLHHPDHVLEGLKAKKLGFASFFPASTGGFFAYNVNFLIEPYSLLKTDDEKKTFFEDLEAILRVKAINDDVFTDDIEITVTCVVLDILNQQ